MGRKLDLSGLTDDEAEHVLKVVQRDMKLRKKEEERLSEMKQELVEEGSRCSLLTKQHRFNELCCIRCCSPFTFLLNPKRSCLDCSYNVCKACRTFSQRENGWICTVCQKGRLLRTQSLEWYYNNVKSRFKRFGSAKVLKTLYRKHIIEKGVFSDLPEVASVHEGSNDNDGSACGSDSTFYKQSEDHSMAETLTIALRVAEEAIEEAINKAESCGDSLEKQNEARYLRDHREELIEELATTIVQKIIQRGKRSDMQMDFDFMLPQTPSACLPSPGPSTHTRSPTTHTHTSTPNTHTTSKHSPLAQACFKSSFSIRRSRSAFSLTSEESPEKDPESTAAPKTPGGEDGEEGREVQEYSSLKRDGRRASLPTWKSVDRLDNSSASSVLQSPDGNWIALQSSQLSRPSLLTKRKSLVFSALEKESGVVSAYDEMGSESDPEDEGGWGAALAQFRRKYSDETYYTDSQHDPEWTYTHHPPITSPSSGQYTNTETLNSDSEPCRSCRPGPLQLRPTHSPHLYSSAGLDVNFNPRVAGDSSEAEERQSEVKKARRRRRSKREGAHAPCGAVAMENTALLLNALMIKRQLSEESPLPNHIPDTVTPTNVLTHCAMTPEPEFSDTVVHNSISPGWLPIGGQNLSFQGSNLLSPCRKGPTVGHTMEHELKTKLCELVGQVSDKDMISSEDEPIRQTIEWLEGRERRERESERQRGSKREKERQIDSLREKLCEMEQERRNKKEIEKLRERQVERQISQKDVKDTGLTERRIKRDQVRHNREMEDMRERQKDDIERQSKNETDRPGQREQTKMLIEKVRLEDKMKKEKRGKKTERGMSKRSQASQEDRESEKCEQRSTDGKHNSKRTRLTGTSPDSAPAGVEDPLHPEETCTKYSAASLCSITTEVLKVLNATEELIGEAGGEGHDQSGSTSITSLTSDNASRRLDQHLTKMEENVYLTAGAVYGLEGALGDLEDCARSISSTTSETELAFLEDQVATAAAQVQQSELQISDIEARISALKTAGLNVSACSRFHRLKPKTKSQTIDSSRQQRRKLPAPPIKEKDDSAEQ
ncbi:rab effector MyRIP isoform X2 [Denticeps clupeoides]|nr:rab effector MyRIP isoform X2 [Denticeps clupeoides]XP_028825350.1 rab effector MyRIP isoform X2 [Denticeps clupeoides]